LLGEYLGMADATAASVEGARLVQRTALATGDAFVCAGERQRDLWLGVLAGLGRIDVERYRRDPALRDLIDVVPFGLPAEPPVAGEPVLKGVLPGIGPSDRVLLWGGGIWNWLDPLTVIRAVELLSRRRDDVKLVFLGLEHPQVGRMEMADRAVELARSLDVLDRSVFFRPGWVPYEERQAFLLEADLGVSAHFDTFESRFAFRTRLLDHFWAGVPTVTTAGDELGDLVGSRGLGRAVAAEDVEAWVEAVEELLDDREVSDSVRANVATVRDEFAWPRIVAPLARLLDAAGAPVAGPSLRLEELGLRLRSAYAAGGTRTLAAKLARKARSSIYRRST
jgi:glycosyltransferase involved in cell wall biosynthesis